MPNTNYTEADEARVKDTADQASAMPIYNCAGKLSCEVTGGSSAVLRALRDQLDAAAAAAEIDNLCTVNVWRAMAALSEDDRAVFDEECALQREALTPDPDAESLRVGDEDTAAVEWKNPTLGSYVKTGFLNAVMRIAPPGAPTGPGSKLKGRTGKIPSCYDERTGCYSGLKGWTKRTTSLGEARRFDRYPVEAGIGLRTRELPVIDNDCEYAPLGEAVLAAAKEILGPRTVLRTRINSPRWLLAYRLAPGCGPIGKQRVEFVLPQCPTPPGKPHAIEILANMQQFVAEGMHASGVPYVWPDLMEGSPADVGFENMPIVTPEQLQRFLKRVAELVVEYGGTVVKVSRSGANSGERLPIGDEALRAKDLGELARALAMIPNDLDYGSWVGLVHALKAASGGDEDFYADSVEPWCLKYGDNTRERVRALWDSIKDSSIGAQVVYGKAHEFGFKGGVDDLEALPPDPEDAERARKLPIRFAPGEEHQAAQQAEKRLRDKGVELFRFGARLVEIAEEKRRGVRCEEVDVTVLQEVEPAALQSLYSATLKFEKWNGKTYKPVAAQKDMTEQYLSRPQNWQWSTISGISDIPVLTPTGKLIVTPGYDRETGLVYRPSGLKFSIPERPTKDDAVRALHVIEDDLLSMFPFITPADRAVALSYILTYCARHAAGKAPLTAVSSPKAGTGKGKIINMGSMLGEGRYAAGFDFSAGPAELGKALDAALRQGLWSFHIDNVTEPLGGSRLCTTITEEAASVRILGKTLVGSYTSSMMFTANGNNLTMKGDMQRRAIQCYIDAQIEAPDTRSFDFDPVQRAKEGRGRYVSAAITVLVAYMGAGMPVSVKAAEGSKLSFGSFEAWANLVCGALLWAGYANPLDTRAAVKAEEPETDLLRRVLHAWKRTIGFEAVTAKGLVEKARTPPSAEEDFESLDSDGAASKSDGGVDALLSVATRKKPAEAPLAEETLLDALLSVASDARQVSVDANKLSYWLRANKNNIVDYMRIVSGTVLHGAGRWQLETLTERQ